MEGLIAEAKETMSNVREPAIMDAALIASAQRVEHYEIAAYGTVRTFAQTLGETKAVTTLQQTLDEEGQADKKLTQLAEQGANEMANAAASTH